MLGPGLPREPTGAPAARRGPAAVEGHRRRGAELEEEGRVLVGLAARSLAEVAEEVTLAQYRALIVLASNGPQRVASLAEALGVTPPTATRMRSERPGRRRASCGVIQPPTSGPPTVASIITTIM